MEVRREPRKANSSDSRGDRGELIIREGEKKNEHLSRKGRKGRATSRKKKRVTFCR